jgi:hypothetical protein
VSGAVITLTGWLIYADFYNMEYSYITLLASLWFVVFIVLTALMELYYQKSKKRELFWPEVDYKITCKEFEERIAEG